MFDPCGSASWFLLEFDPVEKIAFSYVTGMVEDELGYIVRHEVVVASKQPKVFYGAECFLLETLILCTIVLAIFI